MTEENTALVADDAGGADAPPSRDYESEARAQGWVPEAEWKGDKKPAQFLDAETFVKRGEEILPVVRRENQQLKRQLDETKAEFAKRLERMERVSTSAFEAQKRAHEAEIARVKAAQRAAVEAGDATEFDRLDKVRDGLEKAAPKVDEPEKPDPAADLQTRQDKWRAENEWFDSDFEVQDWAIRFSDFHGRKNPHLSFEENMAVVTAEAKKKFPEKFGLKKSNGHSAVDAGSDFGGAFGGKGKKTAADLPPEAKAAGEKFVRDKLYKNLDEYAKEYWAND